MKFLCIIVAINFILEKVDALSVVPSIGNETLKISSVLPSDSPDATLKIWSTLPLPSESANETLIEVSSLAPLKRVMSVSGILPSHGILELLEGRLKADKLEYAEDTLLKIYQILNIELPTCDHPAGSKQALLLQLDGIRNKTKELEIYDALISIKQVLKLLEDGFLFRLGLLDPNKRIIKDGFENATDPVHYLRWKKFFNDLPDHAEIRKLSCIFKQNISRIDNFCRDVDRIFSYSYGEIDFAPTGMFIEGLPKCRTILLKVGDMYASEIDIADVLIRLQSQNKELYALFDTNTEDPHNKLGQSKRTKLFDTL